MMNEWMGSFLLTAILSPLEWKNETFFSAELGWKKTETEKVCKADKNSSQRKGERPSILRNWVNETLKQITDLC